jgi:quercetin dioxygenase-like cupin family protein
MAGNRSFLGYLRGTDSMSDREAQMLRAIDDYGAQVNATLHKIDREPQLIDHSAKDYESQFPEKLNGITAGLQIRQVFKDLNCKILEVKFAPMGFAPSHTHPHYCVHQVLAGEIYDSVRGKRYDKKDWFIISPNEVHSSQSISGAIVRMWCTDSIQLAREIMESGDYLFQDKNKSKRAQ